MTGIIIDIIESLKSASLKERIEFGKNYHPTKQLFLGVPSPNQKHILKEMAIQTKNESGEYKLNLAKKLVETNILECQCMAYQFLGNDKKIFNTINKQDILNLAKNLDNWVSVDNYSIHISGKAWRNNILSNADILDKFNSKNFWIRRVALVSTIPLNLKAQGGTGDVDRTLLICSKAIHDHTFMITKALSWALRELSKTNKQAVEEFMENNHMHLHNNVKREVYTKLITGKKNG